MSLIECFLCLRKNLKKKKRIKVMSANMVAVLYLLSALLFIFALRGLSHPESSRLGNIFGIVGMVIAIITTLLFKSVLSYTEIGAAIL